MRETINSIRRNPISISVIITLVINIITVVRFFSKLDSRIAHLEESNFLTEQDGKNLQQQIIFNKEILGEIKIWLKEINLKLDNFIINK